MRIGVYLKSRVGAFTANDCFVRRLQAALPDHTIQCFDSSAAVKRDLSKLAVLITWKFLPSWYALAPQLQLIATPSAGREHIARSSTHPATVIFGAFHGPLMAESLLTMMLYFNRSMPIILAQQHKKMWERDFLSSTTLLASQRVVILGYGAIGSACARLLKNFGCDVTGVKRNVSPSVNDSLVNRVVPWERCKPYVAEADHIVLLLPSDTETNGIVDRELFAIMKCSAYLYNFGRANCYREADLVSVLQRGGIAGAALDVFDPEPPAPDSPLWEMDQVVIMPHGSAIYREYFDRYLDEVVPQLQQVLQ